jgi:hypothetical protein
MAELKQQLTTPQAVLAELQHSSNSADELACHILWSLQELSTHSTRVSGCKCVLNKTACTGVLCQLSCSVHLEYKKVVNKGLRCHLTSGCNGTCEVLGTRSLIGGVQQVALHCQSCCLTWLAYGRITDSLS